ncbi:MAG: VCBS repeat-containing protein [Planctomycetia bacterium]|nr:VCBS repeat-containing protein [Planctomycetia bacterium]
MKRTFVAICSTLCGLAVCTATEFEKPVRLEGAGSAVRVESPGFAAPCWADVDGDGQKDLLVGQFNKGKMQLFKNLGDGKLAAGTWLQADGATAEVPGVW